MLCQNVPDLEKCVELPNVEAVRNFFLSRSLTLSGDVDYQDENSEKTCHMSVNDKLAEVMSVAGINSPPSSSDKFDPPAQSMITSSDSNYNTQESSDDSSKQIEKINHEVCNDLYKVIRVACCRKKFIFIRVRFRLAERYRNDEGWNGCTWNSGS